MVFIHIVILALLILLVVRSINHDNRMAKVEKLIGKVIRNLRPDPEPIEDLLSYEPIENAEEPETTDDN